MRLLPALLAGLVLAMPAAASAGVPAGSCAVEPEVARVVDAIFADEVACDLNDDGEVGAADLCRAVMLEILPACPQAGASLEIAVDNLSGDAEVTADIRGDLVEPSCRSVVLGRDYRVSCSPGDDSECATLIGLAPGTWLHRIASGSGDDLQLQYRRTLVTADTVAESLRFRIVAGVLVVSSRANSGSGSLRTVLQAAPGQPKPLLVRFHDVVFPPGVPTTIALDFPLTTLATDDVTIDATDARGLVGNRIVDAQGMPFGVLAVRGARNQVIGLRLRNAGGSNRDVVRISGAGAVANVLERCVVEVSGAGDGISIDEMAGADSDGNVNIVRECEISGADDKGVKVTTGARVRVERSWIHHNTNGGVQATLGGNLETVENLIEDNAGGTAQNGMSSQGFEPEFGSSRLFSRGDIVRRNGANGAAVRGFALAQFNNSYLAGNSSSGLRVYNDLGAPALASASGTTFACNAVDGAVVVDASRLDLGGGELGSGGSNALTQNNLPAGGANLRNATENIVSAVNNQWEHCGLATTCNDAAIAARDLSDGGLRTVVSPAQAQRALLPPVVTRVSPSKGRAGELLRIYGSRFNAIDGHFDQSACEDVTGRNRCVPLRGNCVKIDGVSAPIEAVTPRMLVVRRPFTCVEPVSLVVTTDQGSSGLASLPFTVCSDAVPPAAGD